MVLQRREQTFLYLIGATIIGVVMGYMSGMLILLAPVVFGLALTISNYHYLKTKASFLIIPIAFFWIFLYGSNACMLIGHNFLIFLGQNGLIPEWEELYATNYAGMFTGCLGALLMVTGVTLILIKETRFRWQHILLILTLSLMAVVIANLTVHESMDFDSDSNDPFALIKITFIYQVFMSVILALIVDQHQELLRD